MHHPCVSLKKNGKGTLIHISENLVEVLRPPTIPSMSSTVYSTICYNNVYNKNAFKKT